MFLLRVCGAVQPRIEEYSPVSVHGELNMLYTAYMEY